MIADANKEIVIQKTKGSPFAEPYGLNINDTQQRKALVSDADLVISMMPPDLHYLIACDCVEYSKHLLTASYLDDRIKELKGQIESKHLLFLCEMGLDPGIDHMSAMQLIDEIHSKGGRITSFKSHCGGLVAPESDDNPWRYKISWNPRNIVLAGKAGAKYRSNGQLVKEQYDELFDAKRGLNAEGLGFLSYYPNRDSLPYIDIYGLPEAETFVRTTLRYPDFMDGWNNIVALKLTDETAKYDTNGLSLAGFFTQHLESVNFDSWLAEKKAGHAQEGASLALKQLLFLGMDDDLTVINKGVCSAADVLQFALEKKLALSPSDHDMIVMIHEFEYRINNTSHRLVSELIVKGDDQLHTAMAKTVGLPLGIAAKLILEEKIHLRGLNIPTQPEIYLPVLEELKKHGIVFTDKTI